jgi:Fe-S-cluster containining protein
MDSEKNRDTACRRCGACCHVDVTAYVTPEEIGRWEKEGRSDIIAHLRAYDITWSNGRVDKRFGSKPTTCLMSCVYLKWHDSYCTCEIYETRTIVCRSYIPGSSELCPLHRKGSE